MTRSADTVASTGVETAPPCTLVIFGAAGDLTKRLLAPALYNLAGSGLLNDALQIFGLDHNDNTTERWRDELGETMQSFTKDKSAAFYTERIDEKQWGFVAERLTYVKADFADAGSYRDLKERLDAIAGKAGTGNAVFYLAVADRFFGPIVDNLGAAGLLAQGDDAYRRVVIEKPFGSDLPSARALNERVTKIADETQIYRIDHFLGKEPVQSIMAMRFGNGLFEPMWRREQVDHVQITAAETIGVEERGGFYEATGALRDMVPNHLFQLLTMVAMEAPTSFEPEAVRSEKAKLVDAIKLVEPRNAVRGQYGAGKIGGKDVPAYRDEHNVAKDSTTETYAALRVDVENWRWSGVPFYLRTGKRLGTRTTSISIHFKSAPYRIFRDTPVEKMTPNVLTLLISPQHGMTTDFSAKVPGPAMRLGRVSTEFMYDDFFDEKPNVGYETLIYDCMIGDATLFQRADQINSSWAAVQPTRDAWNAGEGEPLEFYASGSAGPAGADALLARDGRRWLPLTTDAGERRRAVAHD
ncbi:MAG: glucose-6-phosphate dehydrogenase [Candidatus Eremiobacteraeota bacterium]|nr:glucose-6-phosphate dehydrogenase [Candidatus Eremiobacteraeota bacterium]